MGAEGPIILLRCLLLAILVGQPSLNRWVRDMRAFRVLRVLAGLPEEDRGPGVGTYYGMLHRLHDGGLRSCKCGHSVAPSEQERRRAASPQPPRCASTKPDEPKRLEDSVTARLVAELRGARDLPNPTDLQGRLTAILLGVAVSESARRELLGDPDKVTACGDGSALVTGAAENGRKTCEQYLRYHEYLRDGLPIATGVIEGACRSLVQDRMDITGARWGLQGAEAVLKVRSLRASDDLNEYLEFHAARELERNHLCHYDQNELIDLREAA